jgi:hypothetical protein
MTRCLCRFTDPAVTFPQYESRAFAFFSRASS